MPNNFSKINEYFDHVYVLNLSKRTDRKIAMLQKLSRLGIKAEFVKAVDGYTEAYSDEYKEYLAEDLGNHPLELAQGRKMIRSEGAWGYLKTYLGILMDAKKRSYNRILCFDDDVVFHRDFENKFGEKIQLLPEDWKLLYLGASQHVRKIPQGFSYPDKTKLHFDKDEPFYFPKATDGSFALGIDSSVFDLLISEVLRMDCSFDSGPLRSVIHHYPYKCFVLNPNIVIADVSESDIQGGRSQVEIADKFSWNLDEYNYPVNMDLVSVILPVYNGELTIEKAMRSILIQSYSNLELIVINDGSTDNTFEIISKIKEEDQRVKLISFDSNKGVYAARNAGIRSSKGVIIAIQDADDISLFRRIEKQLIPLYEKGVLFSVSRIYRSRCDVGELNVFDQEAMMELVESRRIKNSNGNFAYQDKKILGLQTCIFRKSVFEKYGLFDEMRVAGDLMYLERILYYQTQSVFDEQFNAYQFIDRGFPNQRTFQRLDEVLLVSTLMNENNITNAFKKKQNELNELKKEARKRIKEGDLNLFLKLNTKESTTNNISEICYNTVTLETDLNLELIQLISKPKHSDDELNDVINSLSWKITSPLRWIGHGVNTMIRNIKRSVNES